MRKSEDPHRTIIDAESPVPELQDAADAVLSGSLCFLVQRANRIVSRKLDEALRPIGLTSQQMIILEALGQHEALRHTALADIVGKDRATLTANLGPLTSRGLVTSEVDNGDRRVRNIALTADGAAVRDDARNVLETFECALCERVDGEDNLAALMGALKRLGDLETLALTAGDELRTKAVADGIAGYQRRHGG